MSIDPDSLDLQLLYRQYERGNLVLFAGAGFSIGGNNSQGNSPPLSTQLCEILASECGWKYGGEELPVVYDQARRHLEQKINGILAFLYKEVKPAPWHGFASNLFWHRIYTTNVDDVLENAYQCGRAQQLTSITCPHPYQDQDIWYANTQCVHLHGSVLDFSRVSLSLSRNLRV